MSPGLLGIVPIPWLRRTRQFLDAPAAMPQTSWRLSGQKSSRGAFTGSDDRLVLRSPQAQPPVAIAIKVDVDPALGIQFVLRQSVKQVDEGAARRNALQLNRHDAAIRTEVVQRDHRPPRLLPAYVGQDRGVGLLQDLCRRPADLRLLPVRVDEVAHEPPEGLVVVALVGGVDTLRTVKAVGEGTGKPPLLGLGEAAVVAGGPLHGRAYGESSWDTEVFGHPDLLAVEEDRSPWQGEGKRVGHPHSSLVAAEHGGEPSAQSAPIELHVCLGAEGVENLL